MSEQQGWDWTIWRNKVIAYCIQHGIAIPSDSGMRLWWSGRGNPNGYNLLMLAGMFKVEPKQLLDKAA